MALRDAAAAKPEDKADSELSPDDAADNGDAPPAIAPEKSTRSPNGVYEFREERWVELYTKKIEEMIGVMKSKGVPVLWVGLPAVRGNQGDRRICCSWIRCIATAAGKAGITMSMFWDGFVDEAGRSCRGAPTLKASLANCVPMTASSSPGPAHASSRTMSSARSPGCWRRAPRRSRCRTEPATPDANALPGQPAPRPLAGPILPLVASSCRHRPIARAARLPPGRGRRAGGTNPGQGEPAGASCRPRR